MQLMIAGWVNRWVALTGLLSSFFGERRHGLTGESRGYYLAVTGPARRRLLEAFRSSSLTLTCMIFSPFSFFRSCLREAFPEKELIKHSWPSRPDMGAFEASSSSQVSPNLASGIPFMLGTQGHEARMVSELQAFCDG